MSASETLLGLPVPVPVPIAVKFYLVAPPAPGDLAGLVIVANGSPLGTPERSRFVRVPIRPGLG